MIGKSQSRDKNHYPDRFEYLITGLENQPKIAIITIKK